ncbi:uncharacterized protein LOC120354275 [Nilaparvata lugens]|uniref:uncharacterized protein LOC120354275 n=1 Tax=Nilaparvata lugens TaxID=108931 RepID=UPI00193D1E78|nr:uncharacterized protein LOC120354275 [Nilaparvata lugens]
MPIRTKGGVYKTCIRPVLLYGGKTWASLKTHEQKLHIMEMRMLRWSGGVTLKDKIRNEHVRGSFKVVPIAGKLKESRLRWYGHVMRGSDNDVVKKCLSMATQTRERGRPKTTWMTNVQKDMKNSDLSTNDAYNWKEWRLRIGKADPA